MTLFTNNKLRYQYFLNFYTIYPNCSFSIMKFTFINPIISKYLEFFIHANTLNNNNNNNNNNINYNTIFLDLRLFFPFFLVFADFLWIPIDLIYHILFLYVFLLLNDFALLLESFLCYFHNNFLVLDYHSSNNN